jgi:hypothetical protein
VAHLGLCYQEDCGVQQAEDQYDPADPAVLR